MRAIWRGAALMRPGRSCVVAHGPSPHPSPTVTWTHCLRRPFGNDEGDYTRWVVGSLVRLPDIQTGSVSAEELACWQWRVRLGLGLLDLTHVLPVPPEEPGEEECRAAIPRYRD